MRVVVAAALVAFSVTAYADTTVRSDRRVALGLVVPDGLYIHGKDATVPLPGVRLAVALSPSTSVDLGIGYVPMPYDAHAAMISIGVRYLLRPTRRFSPYALIKIGAYDSDPDEGTARRYEFAAAGAGIEYAAANGLGLWLELAPGVVAHHDGTMLCGYGSAGVSYRLPISW